MAGLLQRNTNNNVAETVRKTGRNNGSGKKPDTSNAADNSGEGSRQRSGGVIETLEAEIIPRLVLSCRGNASTAESHARSLETHPEAISVTEFAERLIRQDIGAISDYVASLHKGGASLEWLYLELLSPAARHIGYLWEEDRCSIIDVTLGVGRLQQLLCEFSPTFQEVGSFPDSRRRALLLPTPGEQHTFGLSLLAEFFRRAGWDLWGWPLLDDDDLVPLVRHEWFSVIGISVSAEVNLDGVAKLISKLRRVSSNPALGVLVGGPIFASKPQLIKELGADATAVDARQALKQAESLLSLQ